MTTVTELFLNDLRKEPITNAKRYAIRRGCFDYTYLCKRIKKLSSSGVVSVTRLPGEGHPFQITLTKDPSDED